MSPEEKYLERITITKAAVMGAAHELAKDGFWRNAADPSYAQMQFENTMWALLRQHQLMDSVALG